MQNNQPRITKRRDGSSSNPNPKYTQMKSVTKSAIKKFGPFLLTGLAAVAEHHWLKKEDSDEERGESKHGRDHRSKGEHSERNERSERSIHRERAGEEDVEVQKLKADLAQLREDLKRNDNKLNQRDQPRDFPPSSPRPPSLVRDPRSLHKDNAYAGFQPEHEEEYIRMPFAPTPPISYPAPFSDIRVRATRPPQLYDPPSSSSMRVRDRGFDIERSSAKLRRRDSRLPRNSRTRRRSAIEDDAWHAGKVAAVAGLVEVLHVDDGKGDWVGMKGVRVGTTAAATFGATYLRERDDRDYRLKEVVADVGTGVLVSGLVYGRAKEKREERPGAKRRWTLC